MSSNDMIKSIQFGIYSGKDIETLSVCEVNNKKLEMDVPNSIYDSRMGVLVHNKNCVTCKKNKNKCPGHFGHIKLKEIIIHPLFYKYVLYFLKCLCIKCSRILIKKEQIEFYNLNNTFGYTRFKYILDSINKKNTICHHCKITQPKKMLQDNQIVLSYKNEEKKMFLKDEEIYNIFNNVCDETIRLLGLNPKYIHPKNLILTHLLVIPPVSRPCVMADGNAYDDDLTTQYLEIIKLNNYLKDDTLSEPKRFKYIQSIKFRIRCLFDNSHEKSKHTNGRPMKCIKKRISGKEGQVRANLMGKRVNKSARTVIGPDPTLRVNEIAIPRTIANILTIPIVVNQYNIIQLQQFVNQQRAKCVIRDDNRFNLQYACKYNGTPLHNNDIILHSYHQRKKDVKERWCGSKPIQWNISKTLFLLNNKFVHKTTLINPSITYILQHGDKIYRNQTIFLPKLPETRIFTLQIGDVVERFLQNGDYVILNRQPTLHKGSMLGKKIIIRDEDNIRLNLATTSSFNADFDGDEMNIHVPISYTSRIEVEYLSNRKYNVISSQSSKPSIQIVQDSVLGIYLMTEQNKTISRENFFQLVMQLDDISTDWMFQKKKLYTSLTKRTDYTTHLLFSLLLPNDFELATTNILIRRGILLKGVIKKSILTSSHNCIIQLLYKEYPIDVVYGFINNVQFLATGYLTKRGFSIGMQDCIISKQDEIKKVITKCLMEANMVSENTHDPLIKEIKINAALSKARDIGMRIAKNAMSNDNNFIKTVTSGSKGNFFNIAQIAGLLGQQNLYGRRIKPIFNKGTRALPHYPFNIKEDYKKYESYGFITSSFVNGLSPRDYWFHAITGRDGVTDTAVKTASTGYIQRRMIKLLEDLKVYPDLSVRNSNGSILQQLYGNDGFDPTQTVVLNGDKPTFIDAKRLINRLNVQRRMK